MAYIWSPPQFTRERRSSHGPCKTFYLNCTCSSGAPIVDECKEITVDCHNFKRTNAKCEGFLCSTVSELQAALNAARDRSVELSTSLEEEKNRSAFLEVSLENEKETKDESAKTEKLVAQQLKGALDVVQVRTFYQLQLCFCFPREIYF